MLFELLFDIWLLSLWMLLLLCEFFFCSCLQIVIFIPHFCYVKLLSSFCLDCDFYLCHKILKVIAARKKSKAHRAENAKKEEEKYTFDSWWKSINVINGTNVEHLNQCQTAALHKFQYTLKISRKKNDNNNDKKQYINISHIQMLASCDSYLKKNLSTFSRSTFFYCCK